mmetsp:Transcript_8026/g.18758  ORF Transcript_8026/g.18758 Transcript_8026/m.18758 type:complete len:358 (-) Transcript_8026:58-1131(-)
MKRALACFLTWLLLALSGALFSRRSWLHYGTGAVRAMNASKLVTIEEVPHLRTSSSTVAEVERQTASEKEVSQAASHESLGGGECNVNYTDKNGHHHNTGGRIQPPSLFYVGFGHSGSATLNTFLMKHPLLSMGTKKEHSYLCSGRQTNGRAHTYERYCREFRVPCGVKLTYDLSPLNYAVMLEKGSVLFPDSKVSCNHKDKTHDEAIAELMARLPEVRLFAMLRDPVDWHYSGKPNQTHDWLASESGTRHLAKKTCYADILEKWVQRFPNKTLKIFSSEEMFRNESRFFEEMFEWIGVPNLPSDTYEEQASGRRRSTRTLSDAEYQRYHTHPVAVDCKRRLVALAGRQFPWHDGPT